MSPPGRGWPAAALGLAAVLACAGLALLLAGQGHWARPGAGGNGLALLTQGVLAGHDTIGHDYPAAWWGWQQVRATGQLPLWNPSWFIGLPFIASQTFMPFYPPNWLGAALPFPLAFNVQYPLHLALAALVMLLALRARGLGLWPALLGALAWGFGGHLATLAGPGHIQKLQALAWLPLVTWGARDCAAAWREPARVRGGVLRLGLGLALQVTAGHAQIVYLSLLAGAAEAACVLRWGRRAPAGMEGAEFAISQDADELDPRALHAPPPGWRAWQRGPLRAAALGAMLALGLAAVFWVPSAEFASLSNRGGHLAWEDATRGSLPLEELAEFALPRLRGDSLPQGRGPYLGRYGESVSSAPERIVSDYAGAATLALALFALLAGGPRRRVAAGYLLLGGCVLLLAAGKYLPGLYRAALAAIPGLAQLRSPSTMLALLAYGLASAAAFGAASLLAPTRPQLGGVLPWRPRVYGLAVLFLGAFAWRVNLLPPDAFSGLPGFVPPPGLQRRLLLNAAAHHLLATLLPVLGLMLLFNLVQFFSSSRPVKRLATGALLLGLPLLGARDLLRNAAPFWNAEPVAPYREFLTTFWATPHWERADAPVRYWELGNELSNRALTLSNFRALHQVGSLHGYHPLGYRRYFELLQALGFATPNPHPNLCRLFGVAYLLWPAAGDATPPPEGFFEIARQGGKRLLYNPEIAYLRPVRHLHAVADDAAVLERLAGAKFNAYESTTISAGQLGGKARARDKPSRDKPSRDLVLPDMNLQARILARGPGDIELRTRAARQGLAVVSEPAVPGWKVLVGGQRLTNFNAADGFFLPLTIPAGSATLRLQYDPVSQRLGLYLTCLTLAVCAWNLARHRRG